VQKPVFISYSSRDRAIAEQIARVIESEGIGCWIAPRDIPAGAQWGTEIMDGIEGCRVAVLLLSENANSSPFVKSEIQQAFSEEKVVIPFRIQNVEPDRALKLFVAGSQWIDAWTPPMGERIKFLVAAIRSVLAIPQPPPPVGVPPKPVPADAYYRIAGISVMDSTGTEIPLSDVRLGYRSAEGTLSGALSVQRGQALMNIFWDQIHEVAVTSPTEAVIALRNGKTLGPVGLRFNSITGQDDTGLDLTLAVASIKRLMPIRDMSLAELDAVIRDIPALATRRSPGGWTCRLQLARIPHGVEVTVTECLNLEVRRTQVFRLPGPHSFHVSSDHLEVRASGVYQSVWCDNEAAARSLQTAFLRLNALLTDPDGPSA
jgi:hypothetical protein